MEGRVLRQEIDSRLSGIIDRDYVFLDLPYHTNIGDSLIYEGVMDYLRSVRHKCLYKTSLWTFDGRKIPENVMILFNGGGNFGDLWMECTDFRNRIIRKYPHHKYLIFPQSAWYEDSNNLRQDVRLFSACDKMTICARDNASYQLLKSHFTNNTILLVPDMAFHLPEKLFLPGKKSSGKTLFLRRSDKEYVQERGYFEVPENAEVHDWPTLEKCTPPYLNWYRLEKVLKRSVGRLNKKAMLYLTDAYWQKVLLPYNVREGIRFVKDYDRVYTTRLHTAVIALLLGKEMHYYDNSYKKISALFETWELPENNCL